ncbi:hypothetical protein VPNG_09113 [Cytospora leucostoma]|uniref:Helix-turn-helix domain-containing protein n=1 Tax=Cytospora leucostoma TaxID=1230097 RepID=A0A423VP54_9PEZI|nr:hypothetical protein VPNG_09113 [Cytospora leucostoma]
MGSGASKTVAPNTIRKFPNRAPGSAIPPQPSTSAASRAAAASRPTPSQSARPSQSSYAKDEAIREDGADPQVSSPEYTLRPDYAQRLREVGVVQPNPTYSSSSTASDAYGQLQQTEHSGPVFPSPSSNTVLTALDARARLEQEAEEEFESLGLSSGQGRRFLTSGMIRDVLVMRNRGASEEDIENRLNLRKGLVKKLGPRSLYQPVGGASDGNSEPQREAFSLPH